MFSFPWNVQVDVLEIFLQTWITHCKCIVNIYQRTILSVLVTECCFPRNNLANSFFNVVFGSPPPFLKEDTWNLPSLACGLLDNCCWQSLQQGQKPFSLISLNQWRPFIALLLLHTKTGGFFCRTRIVLEILWVWHLEFTSKSNPPYLDRFLIFSSLTPSYLLKVTKFFLKFSQFEFLVMAGKNIFVYKFFLSLNISGFSLFLLWKLQLLPWKKLTPLFQQPPLKVEVLSSTTPPPPLLPPPPPTHPTPKSKIQRVRFTDKASEIANCRKLIF